MLSIKPTLVIDLISALWTIFVVATLFVWLPINSFSSGKKQTNGIQVLGLWLRIISLIVVGVLSLSHLNMLNWLTLVLWYGGCLCFNYFRSYSVSVKYCRDFISQKFIGLTDILDSGLSVEDIITNVKNRGQRTGSRLIHYLDNLIHKQGTLFFILSAIILIFALVVRWEYPLLELRFSQPDNYSILLITRQLLTRNYPYTDLPVFPALAATISLLGSIEPMQTIRFFSPIIGVALVVSIGCVIWVFLDNIYSALIAMFGIGIYLFPLEVIKIDRPWITTIIDSLNSSLIRQWTGNELELGVIFLLLSLIYCFECDRNSRQTITFGFNLFCCVILILLTAPPLLIILAIASIGLVGNKKLTIITITLAWIILAVFAAIVPEKTWLQSFLLTLPVALSLLIALLFTMVCDLLRTFSPKWAETFCLGLVFLLSLNFWLPSSPKITYLEYDIAARKSIELNRLFPPKTWTLVAPVEQLAEIHGSGWYQDLALFVQQYAIKATKPQFNFPITGEDLFIMVEKDPFVTFPNEPDTIPDSILGDRIYRYYRSTTGRASLEYEALRMCEKYRRYHPNSDIYYEDEKLRIYHFKQTVS